MINDAISKDHPFENLYVWKFSRFSRSMEDSIMFKSLLEKKGVRVVSVSEPITNDIYGKLMERLLEWDAQFYSERLSEEVKRGMTEKASRGEPTCPPPFGYVMRDGCYYPDEDSGKADVVREIFQRYADGEGMREIAVDIGARGIRTRYGNMPENRWIEYMLNNPCYIGCIRWSRDGVRAVSKRDYRNDNIMIVQGSHEPLVSRELWDAVKVRLEEQARLYPAHARREQPVNFSLKGLVRCSACGATLIMAYAPKEVKNRSMQCCNYNRGSCHVSHSVVVKKLESAIIDGLRQAVGSQSFAMLPHKPQQTERKGVDYDKLIALEERRLERAKDAYLAGVDTIEQYAAAKDEITSKIAELSAMRERDNAPQSLDKAAYAEKVAGVLEIIASEEIAPEAKNEALRTVVEKIVYNKPEERVEIYFRGSTSS
jgi:hypothetical protein